jgi:GT2 family glycosyltransferase
MRNTSLSQLAQQGQDSLLPEISLVIATRSRPQLLKGCLNSIAAQSASPGQFEVIVVDNADRPDPAVSQLCHSEAYAAFFLKYAYHTPKGSSVARNAGASLARAQLLAFLDDDDVLPPDWINKALQVSAQRRAAIFGGPYSPIYSSRKPAWFKDEYASGGHGAQACWLEERRYLFAANLLIDRSLFLDLGGFSLTLGPGTKFFYGEETDLQHRAAKRGERIWYDPSLSLFHYTFPAKMSVLWFLKNSWQKGRAKAVIFQADMLSSKTSRLRARISRLRQLAIAVFTMPILLLQIPFRSRKTYPFYQNFVVEKICPAVSGLALLSGLIRYI